MYSIHNTYCVRVGIAKEKKHYENFFVVERARVPPFIDFSIFLTPFLFPTASENRVTFKQKSIDAIMKNGSVESILYLVVPYRHIFFLLCYSVYMSFLPQ